MMLDETPRDPTFQRFSVPTMTTHRMTQLSDIPVQRTSERLQELITDKSILHVDLMPKANWIPNSKRTNCFYCHRKFTPFLRKHHCRSCGDITCRNCNRVRLVQAQESASTIVRARLCFDCIDKALVWKLHVEQDNGLSASAFWNSNINSRSSRREDEPHDNPHELTRTRVVKAGTHPASLRPVTSAQQEKFLQALFNRDQKPYQLIRRPSEPSGANSAASPHSNTHCVVDKVGEELARKRLAVLTKFSILEKPPIHQLQSLCQVAIQGFGCEIAAISFFDETRQLFVASRGLFLREIPLELSMCFTLVRGQHPHDADGEEAFEPLIVKDTLQDSRFATHPLVQLRHQYDASLPGRKSIRFYAMAPVMDTSENVMIGSVFVMDSNPHQRIPSKAVEILASLSSAVEKLVFRPDRIRHSSNGSATKSSPAATTEADVLQSETKTTTKVRSASVGDCSSSMGLESDNLNPRRLPGPIYSHAENALDEEEEEEKEEEQEDQQYQFSQAREHQRQEKRAKLQRKLYKLQKSELPVHMRRNSESAVPYLDLLCQISDTQQQLAVQQQVLLTTLHDHSSRLGSIENCIERMKETVFSSCPNSPMAGATSSPSNVVTNSTDDESEEDEEVQI